jgi:DNA excision repair protein ERCC-3
MPLKRRGECHVVTYQSRREINHLAKKHKQFMLCVFDEVHHLPAKTFMRLSTIPTKYRVGLTGSPYREDGHINYIMALTGYPMGLAWSRFIAQGIITLAQIQVHILKKQRHKLALLDDLLKRDLGKTMIFSDSLDLGSEIAHKYGIEWIHGATRKRIDKIDKNERIVISRVGDEGLSIPELDTIIEIDFLGGSRMQALQRVGRLAHRALTPDKEPAVHHILMTEDELEKYGKRLLAYYDKGYKVDYLYHT